MEIRDFLPPDWELYRDFSLDFYSGGATLHLISKEHLLSTFQKGCEKNPLMRGLILEEGGTAVGYALLSFTWSNEAGGLAVLLEELYVAPQSRGSQLGSRFLDWVFESYPEAKRIRLEVCRGNVGALRLYERHGFEPLDYLQMVRDRG